MLAVVSRRRTWRSRSFVTNSYYQLILTLVPIWALFGVSWNILSGYGGQLSFGHASFFGIGAYTVTLALVYWDLTPWLGIPLGMVIGAARRHRSSARPRSACAGTTSRCRCWPIRWPSSTCCNISASRKSRCRCTGRTRRRYLEFTDPRSTPLVAVGLLVGGVVVCMLVENSRFGLALLAIRQNELAAEAAGINARRWKMRALIVSGHDGRRRRRASTPACCWW